MTESEKNRTSRYLSLILRHKPEAAGIVLDKNGWTDISVLLKALKNVQHQRYFITREELQDIVDTNDKKRFVISGDGKKIRASQGHSIDVNLGYIEQEPPEFLYHGTSYKSVESIYDEGINKMSRTHVHLSVDMSIAKQVGSRHGDPFIFVVRALDMHKNCYKFYKSDNGVWLTEDVPVEYLLELS